ncbi:MAG: G/T mismatches repair enzyme [Candidatus Thorarchaeota archaeon AB_25]|nr:MAG: G/T mismatches repair enzyme [Candidatus Thorarchaeota archaeon AB_25]
MCSDARKNTSVRKRVINWYEQSGRRFPWRNTTDPYHILIAEILLRRTTASAVSRVFTDFIHRFDSPNRLKRARESTIVKALSSLGLQDLRAKQLKETASILVKDYNGIVPRSDESLQSLLGVGDYIASAVRNFAFGEPVPLVDGNVIHFISRVFGIHFAGPTDVQAWEFMTQFGNPHEAKLYWGIIDLVATVCLRQNPRCGSCPLTKVCEWYTKGDIASETA